jgi:hypothetical protein
MTTFLDIKKILDDSIAAWTVANGKPPRLTAKHGDPSFGWSTLDQLLSAKVVKGNPSTTYQLIDPALKGNGQGAKTNLVVALTTGVAPFAQMPDGGPFIDPAKIKIIADWIDANCPA